MVLTRVWSINDVLCSPKVQPAGVPHKLVAQPVKYSGSASASAPTRGASELNEHRNLILTGLLGLDEGQIENLRSEGAFGDP